MKKINIGILAIVLFISSYTTASAQGFLPDQISSLFGLLGEDGSGANEFVTSRISTLLLFSLGGLVLAAVIYAGFAALKYIRSQGDPGQIEEAGKAVKAIFMGVAVLLLGIVGVALIFVFFGATLFDTTSYQVCLSAANSQGCIACKADDGGLPDNWDTIKFETGGGGSPSPDNQSRCTYCEYGYFQIARNSSVASNFKDGGSQFSTFENLCME